MSNWFDHFTIIAKEKELNGFFIEDRVVVYSDRVYTIEYIYQFEFQLREFLKGIWPIGSNFVFAT